MSFRRKRGCSRASATWPAYPPQQCLKKASQAMGALSTSNLGDQVWVGRRTWATGSSSQLSTEPDLLLLWSCDYLCCLLPLGGPTSPSSGASTYLFLLRSGLGFSPRSVGSWGRGGGFTGGLDLLLSWGEGALFLPFMSSLKLGPVLGAISSSLLSKESPTWVIIGAGV